MSQADELRTFNVIIAGGRSYKLSDADKAKLDALHAEHNFTLVISGCATGADTDGETWAESRGIPVHREPADWKDISVRGAVIKHNRRGEPYNAAAGHIRNRAMARIADAVVLFPGGDGTAGMRRVAKSQKLMIFDYMKD